MRAVHREGRQGARGASGKEGAGDRRAVFTGRPAGDCEKRADKQRILVCEPAWREDQPGRSLEDSVKLRKAGRVADVAYAAHAAAQLCHALAGAWRGSAVGAVDAGTRRYFHHADLYPCGRRAVETGVQSASSTRIAWGPEVIAAAAGSPAATLR